MLTGAPAFAGDSVAEILAAVLKSEPDWSRLSPDTPSSIRRLLRRCLQKDRSARLQSAGDARIEIDEARSEA
jgi:serine/threonine protein kinase